MPTKYHLISPYSKRKLSGGAPANNATVQAWLNKISSDGYTAPTAPKIAIYNTAWDYADAQGLTSEFDLVGLLKVENQNLCKVPFIHSGGAARRFNLVNSPVFTSNSGLKSDNITSGYLNANWNQSTDRVKWQLNNASFGVNVNDSLNAVLIATGSNETSSNFTSNVLYPRSGGNLIGDIQLDLFSSGASFSSVIPSSIGLSCLSLLNYIGKSHKNGVAQQTIDITGNEPILSNANTFVLTGCNDANSPQGSYYTGEISFFYYGSGSIDQAKLNTFVNLLLL